MKNEQTLRRMVGLWIFTFIVTVILIAAIIWGETIKNSYKKDLERIRKTYLSLNENAVAIEVTKRRRVEYFKNLFWADFPFRYAHGAADFMWRLSVIKAKGIELIKLETTPRGQDLAFDINIGITAADNSSRQRIFTRYYQSLKNMEGIMEINFFPVKPGAGKINNFKIVGIIELE